MKKILILVVIYNKYITCIEANINVFKSISCFDKSILIVDNSDKNNQKAEYETFEKANREYCENNGLLYYNMNGNKGISKAYNKAIEELFDNNAKYDFLIIFDDDTPINNEYFEALNKYENEHPDIDIFVPIVYGQDGVIYSPNEFHFLKNRFIKDPNEDISQDKFNAIASGLAIRSRVLENYRFNERLFVDQVDQYFFCEQRKLKRKFYKMDVIIHQNFYQRGSEIDPSYVMQRLKQRIKDIYIHARLMKESKYLFLAFAKNIGLCIQLSIKTKSISLLMKMLVYTITGVTFYFNEIS